MQDISIIGIIVAVVVLVILLFMAIGYVKAPPDMAYIISGVKKKSKVVIGKASIRIPFFERLDKLNLRLIPIDVKTILYCLQSTLTDYEYTPLYESLEYILLLTENKFRKENL